MSEKDKKYILLVALHVALGIAIYTIPFLSKVYAVAVLAVGTYFILQHRNKNNEALIAAGYMVGCEVLLRMTEGNLLYELGKYSVIAFLIMGTYFSGFSKNGVPYWIFLLLLVPGVLVAMQTLGPNTDMRKSIAFNISGPVCLGIASLYCYARRVTQKQIDDILLYLGLPIISIAVYLTLYTPNIRESIVSTSSNFATSGGFGPNQVATMLGIGMFVFVSRIIFNSHNRLLLLVNLALATTIAFRGLITFSRGGMITGLIMIIVLMLITYTKVNARGKRKMNFIFVFAAIAFFSVWSFSYFQTGGLIEKRYANQDATGKVKESQFSGREKLAQDEIEDFLSAPIFGIGVAKGAELRLESGEGGLSHNEVTRMLAEHGAMGIMALVILMFTPLVLYIDNKQHLFLLCFLIFWLLTINHAAMRLAAPAFVYALSLLKLMPVETPVVHRK